MGVDKDDKTRRNLMGQEYLAQTLDNDMNDRH